MKIAVIDNFDSFVYNLVRYVEESIDGEVKVYRNDNINFSDLENADGILLSPGPGIPSEAGELQKVIKQFSSKKSILGVCLGHQALAEFFGGKLVQENAPFHGKSSMIYQQNSSCLFHNIDEQFEVGRYHSWSIDSNLPNELIPTALTQNGNLMAMEHTSLEIYGVQFHPESILTPKGRIIIENWISTLKR